MAGGTLVGVGFAPTALARMLEPFAVTPGDFDAYLGARDRGCEPEPRVDTRGTMSHRDEYRNKMSHFDAPHREDVYVEDADRGAFETVAARLGRLEEMAGHANFQVLHLNDALSIAGHSNEVGAFTTVELAFLEKIFYADATRYGFLGEKSLTRITDQIPTRDVVKIPESGNYLYRGQPLRTYEQILRDVGRGAILTSGVRGVMKQFLLFLRKAQENNGNLSLASRSLAPPGYSFHGISDFDIGQVGLGLDNFTERFAETAVFQKLVRLEYVQLRYPEDNRVGVRFEPWHIKVPVA